MVEQLLQILEEEEEAVALQVHQVAEQVALV
jgi:hypothetical protein